MYVYIHVYTYVHTPYMSMLFRCTCIVTVYILYLHFKGLSTHGAVCLHILGTKNTYETSTHVQCIDLTGASMHIVHARNGSNGKRSLSPGLPSYTCTCSYHCRGFVAGTWFWRQAWGFYNRVADLTLNARWTTDTQVRVDHTQKLLMEPACSSHYVHVCMLPIPQTLRGAWKSSQGNIVTKYMYVDSPINLVNNSINRLHCACDLGGANFMCTSPVHLQHARLKVTTASLVAQAVPCSLLSYPIHSG